jgi:hypothetical protein
MARRGRICEMKRKFEDYDYVILGVGGIGKTTLAHEVGKKIAGSDEGTFIITCGAENEPMHINGAFGETDKTFEELVECVNYLCEHKDEYPHTKFVAIDSLDELVRIACDYVVREWNRLCEKAGKPEDKCKSVAQAYKGFQKGEDRAIDLIIKQIVKLKDSGYHLLYIGHTKVKSSTDVMQDNTKFDQLTCSVQPKFYNAIKDKANLAVMCYFENEIVGVKEEKNPFNKKMEKKGTLVNKKRVMLFTDDSNTVDTKTHFEYIVNKADMSADNLIEAVEDAIAAKLAAPVGAHKSPEMVEMAMSASESSSDEDLDSTDDASGVDDLDPDTSNVDLDMDNADTAPTIDNLRAEIQGKLRTASAEVKKKAREILITEAADPEKVKLADATVETLNKILAILD